VDRRQGLQPRHGGPVTTAIWYRTGGALLGALVGALAVWLAAPSRDPVAAPASNSTAAPATPPRTPRATSSQATATIAEVHAASSAPTAPAAASSPSPFPLDRATSGAAYSPLGSLGSPWVSRFRFAFIKPTVGRETTDPERLEKALTVSLQSERELIADLGTFEELAAHQPWKNHAFQCFAFLASPVEVPLPSLFVLGGRDYVECASPESSADWWATQLGVADGEHRAKLVEVLRAYERERRKLEVAAHQRLLKSARSARELVRPSCIVVVGDRTIVLDESVLPALGNLNGEFRELSSTHWSKARAIVGQKDGTR
jgi:hypothetical protein